MANKLVTSREDLLKAAEEILINEGFDSLTIRKLAKYSQVSLGTIYNYFSSKEDLLDETTKRVWEKIFFSFLQREDFTSFIEASSYFYDLLLDSFSLYGNFLLANIEHFHHKEGPSSKGIMDNFFTRLREKFIEIIEVDKAIKGGLFKNGLSVDIFLQCHFDLLIASVKKNRKREDFIAFIKGYLY